MVNAFFQTPLTEDIAVLPLFLFKLISLSVVFKALDYVWFFFQKVAVQNAFFNSIWGPHNQNHVRPCVTFTVVVPFYSIDKDRRIKAL